MSTPKLLTAPFTSDELRAAMSAPHAVRAFEGSHKVLLSSIVEMTDEAKAHLVELNRRGLIKLTRVDSGCKHADVIAASTFVDRGSRFNALDDRG